MICFVVYFVFNFCCKGIKYFYMIYQKIGKIVRKGLRCHRGMITPPCHHFHFSLRREKFFPAQVVIFPCPGSDYSLGGDSMMRG